MDLLPRNYYVITVSMSPLHYKKKKNVEKKFYFHQNIKNVYEKNTSNNNVLTNVERVINVRKFAKKYKIMVSLIISHFT